MTSAAFTTVRVDGEQPYDIVVGHDVLDDVAALVPGRAHRVAVVSSSSVVHHADAVVRAIERRGVEVLRFAVPDGEAAKDLSVVTSLWQQLGAAAFTRSDAVVGVGGGAVTDVAGFAAATWLRGVAVVQVPTTLLAMVDAAIGGKTGINTAAGKNLVGAFHPPAGVICDLSTLRTMPAEDYASGLAEVVKTGFVADPHILELIESDPAAARRSDGPHTHELIERSVRVKARVVSADLRESGLREILNYGHTLGHAIEKVERYTWRHGAAVSVGMVFAAALGRLSGRLDAETAGRHAEILGSLGLPLTYDAGRWRELLAAMRVDKKTRGSVLRFVVLDGLAKPGVLEGPEDSLLESAFAEVARS